MTYVVMLLGFTAGLIFFCSFLIPQLFRHPSLLDALYLLPFFAFIAVWYVAGLRIGVWRAFGVEQIVIEGGVLCWTRTALWWAREVEISVTDVADIKAIKPWHALSNHVELTARNRRYRIGDLLLQDETTELAQQLRHAVSLKG